MGGEPERGRELGIATWFAPILGPLLCIDLYLYQAKVNQQDFDALYLIMFAGLGGIAGLVICVLDRLRAKKTATETTPDEVAMPSTPKPQDARPSELQRAVGAGFVAVSLFLLLIGRFVVAVFFPEFTEGEFSSDKVKVLLPVWTIGIVGIILWLWPSRSRDSRSKEAQSDDSVD
jgi:hypothetical protein